MKIKVTQIYMERPFEVIDGEQRIVRRAICELDPETGEVWSFVIKPDGSFLRHNRKPVKRKERFPAPLTWRKMSRARERKAEMLGYPYWDFNEVIPPEVMEAAR